MATGPPWNTRLAITWTDRGVAADGVDYENDGVHVLRLKWGRLVELLIRAQVGKQHSPCGEDRGWLSAEIGFRNPFTYQ